LPDTPSFERGREGAPRRTLQSEKRHGVRNEIWVFGEHRHEQLETVTLEILGEARRLAGELKGRVCACLTRAEDEPLAEPLVRYGAERIYLMTGRSLQENVLEQDVRVMREWVGELRPRLVMTGASPLGSELAARLAAGLRLVCLTEAKRIAFEGERLSIAKSGFNDKRYLMFDWVPKRPVVVTVLPGDMETHEIEHPVRPEIIRKDTLFPLNHGGVRVAKLIKGAPSEIDLEEAELIVAAGRGVDREGLPLIEKAADLLQACLGGTRALVDEGMIGLDRQIGITGKTISPKVLIALGVSGAREFMAGVEGAGVTIAVNTDSNARIFDTADLGVHADLRRVVPALIAELQRTSRSN
jgi:electron transfer flavoprotein alpha subunit